MLFDVLNLSIRSFAGKYPQKKLLVLLEELRTHRERNTLKLVLTISCYVTTEQFLKNAMICLRYLARGAVMRELLIANVRSNPGARISQLEIPGNLHEYLRHPV